MSDSATTVQQLRDLMADFVRQRDWSQFHSPKNLSMSIAIEAAELMEHFQWISQDDSRRLAAETKHHVGEELADVMCYCLALSNSLEIDLSQAIAAKMVRNRDKYPADEFRGLYGLDDPRRNRDD